MSQSQRYAFEEPTPPKELLRRIMRDNSISGDMEAYSDPQCKIRLKEKTLTPSRYEGLSSFMDVYVKNASSLVSPVTCTVRGIIIEPPSPPEQINSKIVGDATPDLEVVPINVPARLRPGEVAHFEIKYTPSFDAPWGYLKIEFYVESIGVMISPGGYEVQR